MRTAFDGFARPKGIYLLNHSVGVPPATLSSHVSDTLIADWIANPAPAWDRWMAELEGFHSELAKLCNHEAEWFCHQVNVSSAMTKVVYALKLDEQRPVILLSERAFPSLGYVAQAASAAGYQTRMIPRDLDVGDPEVWKSALSNDVAIACLGHAESNTGIQVPVAEIASVIRSSGAVSLVDVAQSAGVLPIDLHAWGADFVVGTSVKWIGGGPGAGFLWVSPDLIDQCQPLDVGWFSHEDPFEFDIHRFRLAPDARRFWGGTPSPIPAAQARQSLAALNRVGVDTVRAHNLALTQQLIDGVDHKILVSPADPARRSGTVVLDPGERRGAVMAALHEAGVHVDERAEGIRISPHVVNTAADIEQVLAVTGQAGV